jgi:hypothetical protein
MWAYVELVIRFGGYFHKLERLHLSLRGSCCHPQPMPTRRDFLLIVTTILSTLGIASIAQEQPKPPLMGSMVFDSAQIEVKIL